MKLYKILFISILSFFILGCNQSPEERAKSVNEDKFFSDTRLGEDADFLVEYAASLNYATALSELASERLVDADLLAFANEIRTDHYRLKNELSSLAGDFQIEIPAELSLEQKAELEVLDAIPQAAFAPEYLDQMMKVHEGWGKEIQEGISNTKVEPIMDFSRKVNDHHFRHMEKIKKLKKALKVNS
jgi:putative membrane protein